MTTSSGCEEEDKERVTGKTVVWRGLELLVDMGTLQSQQICVDAPRQSGTNGGKIDDGGGDACRSCNNIGSKDRQIKARVWKPDAVKNLQTETQTRYLEMEFA